ncbi:ABC transporter substrate-binding protein [Paucidesulfovibrio longus]|uniref:ABC transporter substrate-binding protein n=1 Tax=Paucidesulfovibrio longus TaxID=889 RepID=UPI0003B4E1A5|nr:ABC transporter substrate binding protein [Paucidesulfovibrio longus]
MGIPISSVTGFHKPLAYALLLWAVLLFTPVPMHAETRHNVLLINSYHQDYIWVRRHNEALRRGLAPNVDLTVFDMDTRRIPVEQHPERIRLALEAFAEVKPELVILSDDKALKYLGETITSQGTPVVYLGVNANPREYFPSNTKLATGVLERPLLKRSIAFIKEVMGDDFKRCLVLFDDSNISQVVFHEVFNDKNEHTILGVQTDFLLTNDWNRWIESASNAKSNGYDAVITGICYTLREKDGAILDGDEVIRRTAAACEVPNFGFWENSIGPKGAIGGLVFTAAPQGSLAASIVMRILNGTPVASIPPCTAEHGVFLFSRSGLDKWGLKLTKRIAEEARFTD